ncbi:FtsX-like permease family protein [candidate division WOR-3 bacterium]|nr:FtsX-like permease family protein [candidate division WOR-3 bacterium]
MKFRNSIRAFSFWNSGHWSSFLYSSTMLVVSTSLVFLFLSLGFGIKSALGKIFSSSLTSGQILVSPAVNRVGFFTIDKKNSSILDYEAAVKILRIEGVVSIDSQLFCTVPASLSGHVPGIQGNYFTDVTIEGIDSSYIDDPVARLHFKRSFYDSSARILPVVISSSLLNLYNAGLAPANKLPGITPEAVIGFEANLEVGRSSITEESLPPRLFRVKLVGLSSNLSLLALGVPTEFVREANSYYHPEKPQQYSSVIVTVESPSEVSKVVEEIEKMGFEARTDSELVKKTSTFLRLVTFGITAFSLIIVISSLTSTIYTISRGISERSGQIGVLRALGASTSDLTKIFSFQVFSIAFVDLLIGYSLGFALSKALDKFIEQFLPSIHILTGGVIAFPVILLLIILLTLSIIPSVIAYFVYLRTVDRNLPELLAE